MGTFGELVNDWGYSLLLLVGFIEFAGLPVATVPILILAGAAAATGDLSWPLVAISAAAGGLAADMTWYGLSRWRGQRLVDTVCNLTSNPGACVIRVAGKVGRVGPFYIIPSKFLPGTGNLIAAASGLAEIRVRDFVLADGAALLLWGALYTTAGYVFSNELIGLIESIGRFTTAVAAIAALLIAGATAWRIVRARRHAIIHANAATEPRT